MVRISDIFNAVCSLLNETGITLEDSDLEEPVVRPSFRVTMDTVKTAHYSAALRSVHTYFNIYYYAGNRGHPKAEIYDIENILSFMFLEPLTIKDGCCVYVDDVEFEKVENGILNCSFDFEIGTEFIDESDLENMEELETDVTMLGENMGEFEINIEEETENED